MSGCPCPGIHRNRDGSLSHTQFLWTGWWGRRCARRGSWCPGGARFPRWVGRIDGSPGHTETDGQPWWIEGGGGGKMRKKQRQKADGDKVKQWISPLLNPNWALKRSYSKYNKDLSHSQSRILGWKQALAWQALEAGQPPLPAPSAPVCGPLPDL